MTIHSAGLGSVSSGPSWPTLSATALPGLTGEIIATVAPHTEADPAAVLVSLLAMYGNAVGVGPHVRIEESRHAPGLYVCVVGSTSSGRKGTSADIAQRLVGDADPSWLDCIKDGLVSGEGLIHHVRDGKLKPSSRDDGDAIKYIDPGVTDKRLMVKATEFAQVLATIRRPDSTLSAVLRTLWDRGSAQTLAKNSPERTTGALVSILAHITPVELRRRLDSTELANGFANRFIFVLSRRSQMLPRGGRIPEEAMRRLSGELRDSLARAKRLGQIDMTDEAWELYERTYVDLAADRPGLLGEVLARAAAQVRRLAMIYALIDQSENVLAEHLRAALELWRYSSESARIIFGDGVGDRMADKLLASMRQTADAGLTRDDIRRVVGNGVPAARVDEALGSLADCGLAYPTTEPSTGGRRPERWLAVRGNATNGTSPSPRP